MTGEARDWLADEGYDRKFGARPLRRTIQRQVETPLSRKILQGELESGDAVRVDADRSEGVKFEKNTKKTKKTKKAKKAKK